jgi:hypothetical protein
MSWRHGGDGAQIIGFGEPWPQAGSWGGRSAHRLRQDIGQGRPPSAREFPPRRAASRASLRREKMQLRPAKRVVVLTGQRLNVVFTS